MIPIEIHQIIVSSNLSVDKIYSIVTLRMSVFFSLPNNVLLYHGVCDKEDLVNSSNL